MKEDPADYVSHIREIFDGSLMRELEAAEKRHGPAISRRDFGDGSPAAGLTVCTPKL